MHQPHCASAFASTLYTEELCQTGIVCACHNLIKCKAAAIQTVLHRHSLPTVMMQGLVNLSLCATLIWHVWTSKVLSGIIGLHWS